MEDETISVALDIMNDSNSLWTDFHLNMGTGTGSDFVPVGPKNPGCHFPINPEPEDLTDNFTFDPMSDEDNNWFSGSLPVGSSAQFRLDIIVPDPNNLGEMDFALRSSPTVVPEPST